MGGSDYFLMLGWLEDDNSFLRIGIVGGVESG